MGIDPRGLAQAMGDAEARLNAVRGHAEAMSAKAAGLDAVVTHQRARIRALEAALRDMVEAAEIGKVFTCGSRINPVLLRARAALTPSETACEPRKPMLSDMADGVIRELHRQGMVSMRSEFDGAVLRIEPATFTETFGCTPVAGDPVCPDCGNRIDLDCCGCGESKEGHNAWNAGHEFVPMGCDCHRATSDRGAAK